MDEIDRQQDNEQMLADAGIAGVCAQAAALRVPSGAKRCLSCGERIERARLRAVPAARHCAECAHVEGVS